MKYPECKPTKNESEDRSNKLLEPDFGQMYWRIEDRTLFRKHPLFSKKRGHFEPEVRKAAADKWAQDLMREETKIEITQIYENSVRSLGLKRSSLKKGDQTLDSEFFRYIIQISQDHNDPRSILRDRRLNILIPLASLPIQFDDVFTFGFNELVIPFKGHPTHRDLLLLFEEKVDLFGASLEENEDNGVLRLIFPTGSSMTVNLFTHEVSFSKATVTGVLSLAKELLGDIATLGFQKGFS